jgi:hypothetical protein
VPIGRTTSALTFFVLVLYIRFSILFQSPFVLTFIKHAINFHYASLFIDETLTNLPIVLWVRALAFSSPKSSALTSVLGRGRQRQPPKAA